MTAYLTGKKLGTAQWYAKRNRPLTGCTVLHTAESVMDTVGPDTGAESVAEFIRTRTTPGSYHDLCDSDTALQVVEYHHGAFHDGTGSNNWALSISWACRTTDWDRMTPEKRRAFLRQGAVAFARQQEYRRSIGAPLTELRLITKAQSDAGESGFTYHGWRDPDRRSDPGTKPPDLFPIDEFIAECRAVLGGEDWFDMATKEDLLAVLRSEAISGAADWGTGQRPDGSWPVGAQALSLMTRAVTEALRSEGVSGAGDTGRMVAALREELPAVEGGQGYTLEQIEAATERAVRRVSADAAS